MAPVRRYLRITKSWVIEVRIYSEPPSIADSWLLKRSDPAIIRVMQAVRPLVMPKLHAQREMAGRKGKAARKSMRDVISGDDFEVSMFLTENPSRHTLLTKLKTFEDRQDIPAVHSEGQSSRKRKNSSSNPIDVDRGDPQVVTVRDEDDDEPIDLEAIPDINSTTDASVKRAEAHAGEADSLFVDEDHENEELDASQARRTSQASHDGRRRMNQASEDGGLDQDGTDDKKKFTINTMYRGFAIYGHILCLVVKRRGTTASTANSHTMLENWVSTQAAQGIDESAGTDDT